MRMNKPRFRKASSVDRMIMLGVGRCGKTGNDVACLVNNSIDPVQKSIINDLTKRLIGNRADDFSLGNILMISANKEKLQA